MAHGILNNYKADMKFREDFNNPDCTISNGRIEAWRDKTTQPTEAEIKTWYDNLAKAGYFSNEEVRRMRDKMYPTIGDQLDALYHAGVFPTEMANKIKSVKEKYPKE
jgi:hypothetical protein